LNMWEVPSKVVAQVVIEDARRNFGRAAAIAPPLCLGGGFCESVWRAALSAAACLYCWRGGLVRSTGKRTMFV
jgi:hypothetical protein